MVKKSLPNKTNFEEPQPPTAKIGKKSGALTREPDELLQEILIFNQVYQERKNSGDANQVKELTFLRKFHQLTIGGIHYLHDLEKKESTLLGRPNNVPRRLLLLLTKDYFIKHECLPNKEWLKENSLTFINKYGVNRMELSNIKKSDQWACSDSSARDFLTWLKKQNQKMTVLDIHIRNY